MIYLSKAQSNIVRSGSTYIAYLSISKATMLEFLILPYGLIQTVPLEISGSSFFFTLPNWASTSFVGTYSFKVFEDLIDKAEGIKPNELAWMQLVLQYVQNPLNPSVRNFGGHRVNIYIKATLEQWEKNFEFIKSKKDIIPIMILLYKEIEDKVYFMKNPTPHPV